jgi:hypothetical protein
VLPVPVEAMLLRRQDSAPLAVLSPEGRFEHGDLFPEWDLAAAGGDVVRAAATFELIGSKVGPFVNHKTPQILGPAAALSPAEQSLLYVLPAWYIFGALEQALDLATRYATERVQFGSPIASYQGVAFPLADACAELQGLYELGLQALWSVYESPSCSLADSLALRGATLDIARRVLRTAHQVLGAVGLCDEHDLTIITLAIQARLRLPYDLGRSMSELAATAQRVGFDSLFTPPDTVLPG